LAQVDQPVGLVPRSLSVRTFVLDLRSVLMAAVQKAAQPRRRASGVIAVAALLAVVFAGNDWGFLPGPAVPAVPETAISTETSQCEADGMDALEWAEARSQAEALLMGMKLRNGAEELLENAARNLQSLDEALGHATKPVLIDGASLEPQKPSLLEKVLQPLTKLFMRYNFSIKPRCTECKITVRFGRLTRVCKVRRHKARQPGALDKSKLSIRKWGKKVHRATPR